MANFNFLSGSSIDTNPNLLFNIFDQEECFLGFSKGSPVNQWGINSMIQIEHTAENYLDAIAFSSGDTQHKFYDVNSITKNLTADNNNRKIYIVRYNVKNDPLLTVPMVMSNDVVGDLLLTYINKSWVVIQGLKPDYYINMPYTNGLDISNPLYEQYEYYIYDWSKNNSIQLKIKNKIYTNIPFYATKCELFMSPAEGEPYVKIATGLQKTSNIIGENYVTGLLDPTLIQEDDLGSILNIGVNASQNKNTLSTANFRLVNISGAGIVEDMKFVDPEVGTYEIYTEVSSYEGSQKYLTLKYKYVNDEYQYMKFIIGSNQLDSLAIWQEALPYNSIIPIADANPPGLDLSYLKNCVLHYSLFDVNGFTKIKQADLTYVKELHNSSDIETYSKNGFEVETMVLVGEDINHTGIVRETIQINTNERMIKLYDHHNFVVGDNIFIPYSPQTQATEDNTSPGNTYIVGEVNTDNIILTTDIFLNEDLLKDVVLEGEPNSVNASITLAKTPDKEKALSYGFVNILISKTVPRTGAFSPTENIYRQLFISYRPKSSTGTTMTSDVYNGDLSLYGVNFNEATWQYDNGLLLYLSNKLPVYRKWATDDEQFRIIL